APCSRPALTGWSRRRQRAGSFPGPLLFRARLPSGRLRAAQHRAEIAPAKEVQMEMRHLLVRRGAVVREHAVAALADPFLPRDMTDRPDEGSELGVRRFLREIVDRDVLAFRDDDD